MPIPVRKVAQATNNTALSTKPMRDKTNPAVLIPPKKPFAFAFDASTSPMIEIAIATTPVTIVAANSVKAHATIPSTILITALPYPSGFSSETDGCWYC